MQTIALLTDFGLEDPYVGQLKGAILCRTQDVRLVNLSHGVLPFAIDQGAFFLASTQVHFPAETIFVGVVDPGVGSERKPVCIRVFDKWFVVPDNGLATLVLDRADQQGAPVQAWEITAFTEVSHTFHGRDIFAPCAAELAKLQTMQTLGVPVDPDTLVRGTWGMPEVPQAVDGGVTARVIHVDRFGNCVLNLEDSTWPGALARLSGKTGRLFATCLTHSGADARTTGPIPIALVRTYASLAKGEFGVLTGSQGFLELALNQGSAAQALQLAVSSTVEIGPIGG